MFDDFERGHQFELCAAFDESLSRRVLKIYVDACLLGVGARRADGFRGSIDGGELSAHACERR